MFTRARIPNRTEPRNRLGGPWGAQTQPRPDPLDLQEDRIGAPHGSDTNIGALQASWFRPKRPSDQTTTSSSLASAPLGAPLAMSSAAAGAASLRAPQGGPPS